MTCYKSNYEKVIKKKKKKKGAMPKNQLHRIDQDNKQDPAN